MKKIFALVLALVMALSLTTMAWGAVTEVGTYADFKTAVQAGGEVKLTANIEGDGIVIDNSVTIDLNGFSYTINGKTVGSNHTETLGMQINESAGTVVIKNGSIIGSDAATKPASTCGVTGCTAAGHTDVDIPNNGVKMVIQNYANLTLDGVTVTGNSKAGYVVSNNSGNVVLEDTAITATAGNVAFDTCKYASYAAPTVTVKGTSVITGDVEASGGKLAVQGGTVNGDINVVTGGAAADISVVAGTFTDDVTNYLASGSVYKDGVVVKQGTVPTTGTTSTGSVTTGSVTAAKAKLYRLATAGGSMTELGAVTEIKLTSVAGKIDANVPKYVPNIYSLDGNLYIQVAKAAADYALKNNGTYIYLFDIPQTTTDAAIAAYATSVVMDKLVAPADTDIDCGDCIKGGALASYYVSGTNFYYTDGYTWAYFNGEFVKYDATTKVAFQDHTWDAKSIVVKATDVKGVKVPVSIQCEDCEKTFSIVGATKFDNTWVKGVNYTTAPAVDAYGQYYIVLTSATSANTTVVAPSTDKTVESAQTFDAGIAMYVGMSVMAAAGSAVVIGKKKD